MARVLLLPLALGLGTVLGLGSYYEASDDTSIAWLFSGVLAEAPVPVVPLYFRGYSQVLAALYTAAPSVPWFGYLLGGLLGAATVLAFAVLDRLLRPHWRPGVVVATLAGFFFVAWLEHWLWFSYVRVALLLAGAAVLYAAQRPGRWGALALGLGGLAAAWLMRPSLAMLGFGAVLPAVLVLAGGWRPARPLLLSGALLLTLATLSAAAWRTPAQAHTQTLDGYFARILDFDQLQARPRTPVDSLGTAAVGLWLMGDSTVVNEALCRRAYAFDGADFAGRVVPAKLRLRAGLLVRDYFPVLLALLLTAAAQPRKQRRWFWLVQVGFVGVLLLFAGALKLPPRLALPLLDFWLLTNLALALMPARQHALSTGKINRKLWPLMRRLSVAAGVLALLAYGLKTGHRHRVLVQEQRRHHLALAAINRAGKGRIRVLAGTNDLLKSLSPFRDYRPGPGPVLMLSGWPSHDASQARLRRALTGAADQTDCLRRLAAPGFRPGQPRPLWVLSGESAGWLNRRFARAGAGLILRPTAPLLHDETLHFYQPSAAAWP